MADDSRLREVIQRINELECSNFEGRNLPPSSLAPVLADYSRSEREAGRREGLEQVEYCDKHGWQKGLEESWLRALKEGK